ncbi:MAG: DUF72 domain-containing protein [Alphaproteobacteria bacterium]|nr:DUF72 domain-containing protein [Alphaproteobacteria bacterium]
MSDKHGVVLFQLPPTFKKDLPRLEAFLAALPAPGRAAIEFRHESWFADDTYALLRAHGAALVAMDAGEGEAATPVIATAGWGYLRLRAEAYADAELGAWAERIRAQALGHGVRVLQARGRRAGAGRAAPRDLHRRAV